jgi:hypothetical protein
MTTLAPLPSSDSNTVSSSCDISSSVVVDMRYWKPWQPPDSTATRRQSDGLFSFVEMACRRYRTQSVYCVSDDPYVYIYIDGARQNINHHIFAIVILSRVDDGLDCLTTRRTESSTAL